MRAGWIKSARNVSLIKHIKLFVLLMITVISAGGCSMLNAALSAGVAYGIYKATH